MLAENIKIEKLVFTGIGLSVVNKDNLDNEMILQINVDKKNLYSGRYPLIVSYKKLDKVVLHRFLIPINRGYVSW